MARTFAIGDIHGDTSALFLLMSRLPMLGPDDTLVFLGDDLDRGPNSAGVIEWLMALPGQTRAKVVCLRGNHEDAWLRVIDEGWDAFIAPRPNGCLETLRSFSRVPCAPEDEPTRDEERALYNGAFFPPAVVEWMRNLRYWYEDEHAIYVHAGLMEKGGVFLHPSETEPKVALLWLRDERFFREYRGKRVVFGHTRTEFLPEELSGYTPEDPTDLWAGPCCIGVDTGAGCGGFPSACQLPEGHVYESR
ncbi:MAG: metallophosphoesterase [Polyangiaceae bacterium]